MKQNQNPKTVNCFAPANVSFLFVILDHKNPLKRGALGVGCTTSQGIIVSVKSLDGLSESSSGASELDSDKPASLIYFNNKKIKFPTIESVVEKLNQQNQSFEIKIRSKLPLGAGFGLSGASALAAAYALNKLLNSKKSKKELLKIAHVAEVKNGTGLGDVINQFYGGFAVKFKPGNQFAAPQKLKIQNRSLYYKTFGGLQTKTIINNQKFINNINKAGMKSLAKVKKIVNNKNILPELIKIAKEFAVESGLLINKKLIKKINEIEKNKHNATMIMLGNVVISDSYFKGAKRVEVSGKKTDLAFEVYDDIII